MRSIRRLRTRINSTLGHLLQGFGYSIQRSYREPRSTLNLLAVGVAALPRQDDRLPNIVQIGAYDGEEQDPLRHVLRGTGSCRALLVEPQAEAFAALQREYGDIMNVSLENAAIADHDGTITLHIPATSGSSAKASLHAEHMDRFGGTACLVRHEEVRAMTLQSLVEKHEVDRIDVLQIDTEGSDYAILRQAFALGQLPTIVNLESCHLGREDRTALRHDLTQHGYGYVDVGLDTFAVRVDELGPLVSSRNEPRRHEHPRSDRPHPA